MRVAGRVVDEAGRPAAGLVVEAWDEDPLAADDLLGRARTGEDGRYAIGFDPRAAGGLLEGKPEVFVAVYEPSGVREVARAAAEARGDGWIADARVRRADLDGWAATLGADAPSRLTHGNAVEVLVDGEEAFDRVMALVRGARRSLHVLQFTLRPSFRPVFPGPTLAEALVAKAREGARVRLLLRRNPGVRDWHGEARAFFEREAAGVPTFEMRAYLLPVNTQHAKLVVADDEAAVVVGHPFEQRYWDTRAHGLDEPRRDADRPFHDVGCEVRGPAVADLGAFFAGLWNAQGDGDALAPPPAPHPAGPHALQVARTLPATTPEAGAERGIWESFARALAKAERLAYFEAQYLTSGAFVRALRRALASKPRLEVVVLLNATVDVPTYSLWARRRLDELGHPDHPRVGFFERVACARDGDRFRARPVYVHGKVAVVDDAWASVGSANLDGVSLEGAAEYGLPDLLNVDLNVVLLDGVDGAPATGLVARARRDLWREHLGGPWDDAAPLASWRARAAACAEAAREGRRFEGGVVPFGEAGDLR